MTGKGPGAALQKPRTGGPLRMDPNINPRTGQQFRNTIDQLQRMQTGGQQLTPFQERRLNEANYDMQNGLQTPNQPGQPQEPVNTMPFMPGMRPTFPYNGNIQTLPGKSSMEDWNMLLQQMGGNGLIPLQRTPGVASPMPPQMGQPLRRR